MNKQLKSWERKKTMLNPHQFQGFEQPLQEGMSLTVPRSFFERVVICEPASTIKVVSYILIRSLQGENVIEASYNDFIKELRLSRQAIQEGLARAIEAGYILQLQLGSRNHLRSRYALCWASLDDNNNFTDSGNATGR
jgi:hypothetical protein